MLTRAYHHDTRIVPLTALIALTLSVIFSQHVVGDKESSTDKNFDLGEHTIKHDEPKEGSEQKYTQEDDVCVDDSVEDPMDYTQRPRMLRELDSDLDGDMWQSTGAHMASAMMVAEQVGVRMMKEYFEIEASKATPQCGFRKGLTLFGDKRYEAAKNKLKLNLLKGGCIGMLSWKDLTWDFKNQALGYIMFLKRKRSRKMKGRGCTDGRPQQEYITKE